MSDHENDEWYRNEYVRTHNTDIWWDYFCPKMSNIGPLKDAQSKLIALGVDWAEAGRLLSEVHRAYVDAAFEAADNYRKDQGKAPNKPSWLDET